MKLFAFRMSIERASMGGDHIHLKYSIGAAATELQLEASSEPDTSIELCILFIKLLIYLITDWKLMLNQTHTVSIQKDENVVSVGHGHASGCKAM